MLKHIRIVYWWYDMTFSFSPILDILRLLDTSALVFLVIVIIRLYRLMATAGLKRHYNMHFILFACLMALDVFLTLVDWLTAGEIYTLLAAIVDVGAAYYVIWYLNSQVNVWKTKKDTIEFNEYVRAMDALILSIKTKVPLRNDS